MFFEIVYCLFPFRSRVFFFLFEYFVGVLWGILVRDFFRQTAKWRKKKKKKNKWTSTSRKSKINKFSDSNLFPHSIPSWWFQPI